MPRRREVPKREAISDAKYGDTTVSKFINGIMRRGKRSVAEHILYGAFDIIEKKTGEQPLKVFKQAIGNVKPVVEVKSRRVGGATYQVPIDVSVRRGQSLAMRWIIQSAKAGRGKNMEERLAQEFMEAAKKQGTAVKKKEDTHRMAEANKAFAHYRW
jgi:small subunit ribosomal protein S7